MLDFWFQQVFYQRIPLRFFYTIHSMSGLVKEAKNLYNIKILNVYPHINFMNKGLPIVNKLHM